MEDRVGAFADALAAVDADFERVLQATLSERITEAVVPPAVGVPLSFAPGTLETTVVDVDPTPSAVVAAETGVVPGSFAVAETGSVAIPADSAGVEAQSLYPERLVVVVPESTIGVDLDAGMDRLASGFSSGETDVVFVTGPSATADMDGLVLGAHGPRAVTVLSVIGT